MSTPLTSSAPSAPTRSSPLRPVLSFSEWFGYIRTWILGMSPEGLPYNSGWIATENLGAAMTLAPDWTVTAFALNRTGFDVDIQMRCTYTGAALTAPSSGNIGNISIGTLQSQYRPRYMAGMATGHTGPSAGIAVSSAGELALSTLPPGFPLTAGTEFSFQGMFRTA